LWEGPTTQLLLERYAPELRFPSLEIYRPASAELATSTYSLENPVHENVLETLTGSTYVPVASAYHDNPLLDDLSLVYLATSAMSSDRLNYPEFGENNGPDSAESDYLMALGDHPEYANHTYARVSVDGSGGKILQYWFFYYYNQKTFYSVGDHEGDWEWIQLHLNSSNIPLEATYSQHGVGEKCAWSAVDKTADSRPVVWVAYESHANYFAPGFDYPVEIEILGDGSDVTAPENDFIALTPSVEDVTTPPGWITWNGRWGASGVTWYGHDIGFSPLSPGVQAAWLDALAWQDTADGCSLS
jgi:hypothetical protein